MDELVVAMAQAAFALDDVAANLAKTDRLCADAAQRGARVVVLPEGALTGSLHYLSDTDDLHSRAVAIGDPAVDRLSEIACNHGLGLVIGAAEAGEAGKLYNSAFVFSSGGFLGTFRKMFPAPSEKGVIDPGEATPVFELFGWRFGVGICYDIYFPEVARLYALRGADVFLVPTGGTGIPPENVHEKWWKPWFNLAGFQKVCPARALDNNLFVLLPVAADAGGGSIAVDPRGEQIAYGAGDEELVFVSLNRARKSEASASYLGDLRPSVYEDLRCACEEARRGS